MSVTDAFTRADSALTLGSTDTGQAWSSDLTWGISSNQAYCASGPASGQATAVVETSESDGTIQVTLATAAGDDDGICFRFVDLNNYWIATHVDPIANALGLIIYKQVGGSFTQMAINTVGATNGEVLTVVLSGMSIAAKLNGITYDTVSDSTFQTATKHGLRTYTPATGTTARFDDFSFVGAGVAGGGDVVVAMRNQLRPRIFAPGLAR